MSIKETNEFVYRQFFESKSFSLLNIDWKNISIWRIISIKRYNVAISGKNLI